MTTKHTPGPWFFEDEGDFDCENVRITSDSRSRMISIAMIEYGSAESCMDEPFQSEQIANTHLIAAAPELLEALKGLIAHASGSTKQCGHNFECVYPFDVARAAIAKATGESE